MLTREIRPAVALTELGFGAAQLGNLYEPTTDTAAVETVAAAWDVGVRYFDTAPHYGLGLSERRLGVALRGRPRDEYVVSTKVGRVLDDIGPAAPDDAGFVVTSPLRRRWDFTRSGVLRSLDDSLARLGLDRVDIVYLHDPDEHWESASTTGLDALRELRAQGVVRAIGVGMNQTAMLTRFVRETDIDVVMVAGRLTLLDQDALRLLLPAARDRGVAVVAGAVFNSGILAADGSAARMTYDYRPASEDVAERVRRIAELCAQAGVALPAAALRYPLRHDVVRSVVAGTAAAAQVRENARHATTELPDSLWRALESEGLLPPTVIGTGWAA